LKVCLICSTLNIKKFSNYIFILEGWKNKFDKQVLKAREEIEIEKSMYQKLLSEKRGIDERLEMLERHTVNAAGDGLKRNVSDLSLLSYHENGHITNDNNHSVSS